MTKFALKASTIGILAVSLAAASSAHAAGFYIQEQSVAGLGAAFSGSVTSLDEASTVYFNPAGMTDLERSQMQLGVHVLVPSAGLTDTGSTTVGGGAIVGDDGGNPYNPTPIPNLFAAAQVTDWFWAGIGVTAPFGLANDYDDTSFARYDSLKTELTTIDIQPSVAFKITDDLSIGGGVNIQYADATLTNTASLNGVREGVARLEGNDWATGYSIGLKYKLFDHTVLGLDYKSQIDHELVGRASVAGLGATADFDVKGRANLNLPDRLTLGAAHQLTDKWRLQGQATWFGWNNFENIATTTDERFTVVAAGLTFNPGDTFSTITQNYQTTWAFALGAEYDFSDKWTFRGGMQFDETPTTDEYRTTRTPDGDRTWLSLGASYAISPNWDWDMAATYIWIDDENIDLARNNTFSTAIATTVQAETEGNVGILAFSTTYKF